MQTHARAATELGRLGFTGNLMVSPERAREVPRSELLVIAAGTQAEPQSALSRLAWGDHPRLKLSSGDAVILSSRTIPGNDRAVWDLVCEFERRGIDVHVGATDPSIHVSGHACREEQAQMIEWIQPRAFVPIHGTYHHLMQHAKLARGLGVRNVELAENGQTLLLDSHGLVPGATVRVGRVHIDSGEEIPAETLKERALMAESGAMFLTVPVTGEWRLDGAVGVHSRGVMASAEQIGKVREAVERAVREHATVESRRSAETVKDAARRAARRVLPEPTMVIAIEER